MGVWRRHARTADETAFRSGSPGVAAAEGTGSIGEAMTYSSGNSGYQSAQPTSGSSGPSFAKSGDQEGKLPRYLSLAVVALGLLAYFLSYGPVINVNSDAGPPPGPGHHGAGIAFAALLAGLLAAVGLLPKARNYLPIVAVISVLGALMLTARAATLSDNVSAGWALWAILGLTVVQAIAAVAALLLHAGVVTAPAPRPKYDRYNQYGQYGQYGGGYYGQPGQSPYGQHGGPQQSPQQSGYGPSYGGGGYPQGPSTGGFGAAGQQHGSQQGSHSGQHQGSPQGGQGEHGTSTPPTGFPSYNSPQSYGSGAETQATSTGGAGEHSASGGQQSHGGQQSQSPSSPSGPTPS
jgi:hypothetical protein